MKNRSRNSILVWLIAAATCGSGIVNLCSVVNRGLPERFALLLDFFPLEFLQASRFLVLLIGFALVISSLNILKRKRRAFELVAFFSVASIVFHLAKGIDYEEASVSAGLLLILFAARHEFAVESADFDLKAAATRAALAFLIVFGYGTTGFWLLEAAEFNFNFRFLDAVRATVSIVSLVGKPDLTPQTVYAAWFVRSLYLLTFAAIGYAIVALFRPVVYKFRTLPQERERARLILEQHGRGALDYFKIWRDKSFFFASSGASFIAYRVAHNVAVALGDPVGDGNDIALVIHEFAEFCRQKDWEIAFHQTAPDFLRAYKASNLRALKIGEEAVVDLTHFDIADARFKKLRKVLNRFERENYRFAFFPAPLSDALLQRMRRVSDDWLTLPGRRERTFSLGLFDAEYLRNTDVYAVFDSNNRMLAFVNRVPSFAPGEITFDLMRHLANAPNGTMDFLFTELILEAKSEGFARLNLGMAPLAGFVPNERPTPEERAVQIFLERANFLFSYAGLQNFKAKFTDDWEPRYLIYRNALDLPRIGLALLRVSEIKQNRRKKTFLSEQKLKTNRNRGWKTWAASAVCLTIVAAGSYFAWYELHPRPLPPAGKNQLVLRGQPLDIYFFPAVDGARTNNQKVLFLPGDGGWEGLAIPIAEEMANDGYEVYALDTKRYLQSYTTDDGALTEPQVIDDMGQIARWMNLRWGERVTLVGWSEGAGLVVLGASAPNRKELYNGVVVLGLPDTAELGWRTADDITYITGADPDEPMFDVGKYLPQVAPLPIAVIHSSGDQLIPQEIADKQFALINEPKKYEIVEADSHSFSNGEANLFDTLNDSLAWANKNAP